MRRCLALLFAVLSLPLQAAQLVLELGDAPINWQTEDLLKHPQAQSISIADDVSYKKAMHYRAIPSAPC